MLARASWALRAFLQLRDGPGWPGHEGSVVPSLAPHTCCCNQTQLYKGSPSPAQTAPTQAADLKMTKNSVKFDKDVVIVVFGASGDLAKKKTFPALFGLYRYDLLPKNTKIVGYARTKMDHEEFLERLSSHFKLDDDEAKAKAAEFKKLCSYVSGPYDKDEGFVELNKHVEEIESSYTDGPVHRLFYLALPPSVFAEVAAGLKKNVYPGEKGVARIIIEKPFGHDLESSRELQSAIAPVWSEEEVYRIDHYLGKDMVKNLLYLRFGNQFFNSVWSNAAIAAVVISFKEPFGTQGRGGYFDDIGIIRDVMQNHLLQVMSLVGMERPVSFDSEDIRNEKVKLLKCVKTLSVDKALLGQYGRSEDGKEPAYTDDDTVKDKNSRTVTFAALEVNIDNDRWSGVPFILKAGKALDEGKVEVRIQFKDVSKGIFASIPRNELVIRIQPDEAVYLKMNSKIPGLSNKTLLTDLDLTYKARYSNLHIPEAYESLILDALNGDHSNFVRDDELDISWKLFTPLLHKIENDKSIVPHIYPYGSRGPQELAEFYKKAGYTRLQDHSYEWPVTKVSL